MKVLVIDDDKNISSFLKKALEEERFETDIAENGKDGIFLATTNQYDLIICDFVMPEKNGDEVCKTLRTEGITLPILMLSVKSEPNQKADLLNCGADDYLTKPFSLEELIARVRALLRRPSQIKSEIIKIDDLVIDPEKHQVTRGNKNIYLTLKEFMLLEYLAQYPGVVMSRGKIIKHVWDMNADLFSNTIEAHISNIRKKIDLPGHTKLVHTISGRGYKIDPDYSS